MSLTHLMITQSTNGKAKRVNLKRVGDRVLGALRRRSDTEGLIPALIRIPLCFKRLIEIRTRVPVEARRLLRKTPVWSKSNSGSVAIFTAMSATFTVADATHSLTKRFDGKKALALPGELQAKLVA
jgi:hypothetical protein